MSRKSGATKAVQAVIVDEIEATAETVAEAAEEPTVAPVAEREIAAEKAAENTMYMGPTIAGVVRHSTVFEGGVLPAKVEACVEQLSAMRKLFVPISRLAEASQELNRQQSQLNAICAVVRKTFARKQ